jgi:hypothetical protein
MKALYFPFTTIDALLAERAAATWGPLTLLQPSADTVLPATRRLEELGVIALLFPSPACRENLQELLETLERWAGQHAGSDRGALLGQGDAIPFFDGQSAAQLVAEIRRGGRPSGEAPEKDDAQRVDAARLFLAMAQKFDRQQADLTRAIEDLAAKEAQMLALLKGDDGVPAAFAASSRVATPPRTTHMVDRRLKAWARAMTAVDLDPAENEVVFLTDRPEVAAQVQEVFPEMTCHRPYAGSAASQTDGGEDRPLPDWLAGALQGGDGPAGQVAAFAGGDLALAEIPAMPPRAFLERLAEGTRLADYQPAAEALPVSTWIVSPSGCDLRPVDF